MQERVEVAAKPDGAKIAYRRESGKRPGALFCGGFHSDMDGGKATFLHARAAEAGVAFTRFDYQGHGRSSGAFAEGAIGAWFDDALFVLDRLTEGPQVIVGSSMGGWMALLLARARPDRVAGLALIAPAPDFPRKLMLPSLPADARRALEETGLWDRPSEFADESYPITARLIEESAAHELLDGPPIPVAGPVHILHGLADEIVPFDHARRVVDLVEAPSVALEAIKGGDHRLSTDADLARLWDRVQAVRGAQG
ncbi:MAG: alpha/beta hydrolase [Marivibrio sp.]|uniref:alpha/beta hydrolase n=1 Tax=Marivibrio sp. TaxID=2039719 RepID=UPI0032EB422D